MCCFLWKTLVQRFSFGKLSLVCLHEWLSKVRSKSRVLLHLLNLMGVA